MELYVDQARQVGEHEFWKAPLSLNIQGGIDPGFFGTKLEYAGEDSLRAFLTLLRPLYMHDEAIGFNRIRNTTRLRALAKGTTDAQKAVEAIDSHSRMRREVLKSSELVAILEHEDGVDREVKPEEVFEDFLYGRYFHVKPEFAARLKLIWPELDPMYQMTFIHTALRLAQVFGSFAGTPRSILREPSLLP
jgi:hypothetical protein